VFSPASVLSSLPGLAQAREPRAAEVDGFFAADSMVRRLHRERLVLFSGVRALLMQACDPLAVVGFQRHSVIFDDPQARLLRTDERMSRIYFGTVEEAEETGRVVEAMHRRVRGKVPAAYGPIAKGTTYDASDPELGLWVLATLAGSASVLGIWTLASSTYQSQTSSHAKWYRPSAALPNWKSPSSWVVWEITSSNRSRIHRSAGVSASTSNSPSGTLAPLSWANFAALNNFEQNFPEPATHSVAMAWSAPGLDPRANVKRTASAP